MSLRDFYLERRRAEQPIFTSVLQSLPADRLDYQPNDRSPSARQIVWTLTNELKSGIDAATEFKATWSLEPAPAFDEMLRLFELYSTALTDRVAAMDEASWNRISQFWFGGTVVSEQPVGPFLWYILFDSIHPRGQLSAYVRPMGAKVPSIYGRR